MAQDKSPILHVIVIGFHHKKGCQVEFSYPPLMPGSVGATTTSDNSSIGGDAIDCPTGWKYLPTLGLPDGSHNFTADTVFFNLPSLVERNETVFGVSCYRQIPVDQLKIRTADVTRSTVQKSVCILAALPVFGYVEVKLSLIAQSYFDQGDFARTDILVSAYHQLNACLHDASTLALHQHHFVGLPLRDIVLRWRYKALILFKLMLLQKRVVCFGSPVRPVCALILGIASLHAQLLERGFVQAACVRTSRPMSPMPTFQDCENNADELQQHRSAPETELGNDNERRTTTTTTKQLQQLQQAGDTISIRAGCELVKNISIDRPDEVSEVPPKSDTIVDELNQNTEPTATTAAAASKLKTSLPRDASVDVLSNRLLPLCAHSPSIWLAPFPIYTVGNLCLPYLSLPYMDLLTDQSVRGYTIGTSNILFQQKRQLTDVFVDVEAGTIETANPDVRRQLQLTTEDLRFVDHVLRHVQAPREAAEGSELWIRAQFQGYMLALLRTALQQQQQANASSAVATVPNSTSIVAGTEATIDADEISSPPAAAVPANLPGAVNASNSKDAEHFNAFFVAEWLQTGGWREWRELMDADGERLQRLEDDVSAGHPFAGTLSVGDMKLKLAQTINNSESGRKLNQAVNTTSKAVGGAILQAKGALSNWWSSMTTTPPATVAQSSPDSAPASADDTEEDGQEPEFNCEDDPNHKPIALPIELTANLQHHTINGVVEIGHEVVRCESVEKSPVDAQFEEAAQEKHSKQLNPDVVLKV